MDTINFLYIGVSALATIITIIMMLATPIAKLTSAITKLEVTLGHNMEHTTKHESRLDEHDRVLNKHTTMLEILQRTVDE